MGVELSLVLFSRFPTTRSAKTGFGADGTTSEKELDFEQVRGDFENNTFVTAVLKHIEVKTALGEELIGRLKEIKE